MIIIRNGTTRKSLKFEKESDVLKILNGLNEIVLKKNNSKLSSFKLPFICLDFVVKTIIAHMNGGLIFFWKFPSF